MHRLDMAQRRLNAILFDLGDTVLEFGRVRTTRLFRQGAHLTYDFLRAQDQPVPRFLTYFLRNLFCLRWYHLVSHFTGNDFNSLEVLRVLGARQGVCLSETQWQHLTWLWYRPLSELARVEPDLRETLLALQQQGLKLGIISNTFVHGSALDRHLEQLQVKDLFSVRLYSYQFDFRKPDLRIFQEGARQIGQDCKHVMYVGDRIDKDMLPALKLGMTPALKRARANRGRPVPDGVHLIDKISQLPGLVDKINASALP